MSSLVQVMLSGNVDETRKLLNSDNVNQNIFGLTLLHVASEKGQNEMVELLLKSGADINAKDLTHSMQTPLHLAAYGGSVAVAEILVRHGVEINCVDQLRRTPLHVALEQGVVVCTSQNNMSYCHIKVAEILLGSGADVNSRSKHGKTPLHIAANCGHLTMVNALIKGGSEVNIKSKYGCTPLHFASKRGHAKIVDVLVQNGADFNCQNEDGRSPLHIVAEEGDWEIVQILVGAGADINIQGEYGSTPLHIATKNRHIDVVRVLLDEGANVNCRSQYGRTPLHIASEYGDLEIVTALLQEGADVNCLGEYGRTPLHIACKRGQINVIPVLLEYGADAKIQCSNNLTPIEWAYDFPEIIDILERHFIKVDAVRQITGGPEDAWRPHNGIWSQQRRNEFLRECLQELDGLSLKIGGTDFTYCDLLVRRVPALRDLDVEHYLSDSHHLQQFPIYGQMIDISFQCGRRWRLLERAVAIFYSNGHFAVLPSELVEMICNYLHNRDLELITQFLTKRS